MILAVTFPRFTTRSVHITDAVNSLTVVLSGTMQMRAFADSLVLQDQTELGGGAVVRPHSGGHAGLSAVEIVHYSVALLDTINDLFVGVFHVFTF